MSLKETIQDLILLHQEGPYWDFKREWYHSDQKPDMLLDIICMANNLVDRDAYIIIGIDEENDYSICDVSGSADRKTTQNLTDYLRSMKFAGEYRPVVTVESLEFTEGKVDVIVIHNSYETPFFLREREKKVSENNIYVRLQDSNTPIDQSADYNIIEKLWRKRFGLDLTPIEKVKKFLKHPEDWEDSPAQQNKKYYKYSPEYTIEYIYPPKDGRCGYEYFLFAQTNIEPKWSDIRVKFHQTVLVDIGGVILDGRAYAAYPITNGFSTSLSPSWDVSYKYMTFDSINYLIHCFYSKELNNDSYALGRYEECILFFKNEDEHASFVEYAKDNWENKEQFIDEEIIIPNMEVIPGYNMDSFREQYRNVQILRQMLEKYRTRYY